MIESIKITNFRSILEAEFNTSKVTVICGDNGEGKTSILNAIAFQFKGFIPSWTNKRGDGNKKLIKDGEKSASIITNINMGDESYCIEKRIPGKLFINGKTSTEQNILDILNISKESLEAIEEFVCLKNKEQVDLLTKAGESSEKPIAELYLAELEKSKQEIEDEVFKDFLGKLSPAETEEMAPLVILNEIEANATEKRKIEKANFKNKKTIMDDLQVVPNFLAPAELERVKKDIESLREKRDKVLKSLVVAKETEKKKARKEKIKKVIAELEEKTKTKPKPENIEEIKKQLQQERKTLAKSEGILAQVGQNGQSLAEIKNKLENFEGKCPIAPKINCKLTDNEIKSLFDEYGEKIKKEQSKYKEELQNKKQSQKNIQELEQKLEKANQTSHKLIEWQNDYKILLNNKKELEELEKEINENPAPDTAKLKTEQQEIETKINSLENSIEESRKNSEAKNKKELLEKELKESKQNINAYDFIIKATPAVKGNFDSGINRFLELTNEALASLNLPEAAFSPKNGLEINNRPYDLLSDSEKLRVKTATQHALSQLFNFPFLFIDNLDWLTDTSFDSFVSFIKKIESSYNTILLAGAGLAGTKEVERYKKLGKIVLIEKGIAKNI